MVSDYQQAGIPYDSAGTRIDRLAETVTIIKKFFGGGEFSFTGKHYSIKGLEGAPPASCVTGAIRAFFTGWFGGC